MQLLADKLTAPAEVPYLSRARLVNRLANSMASGNMTIINGRAGTGKTLLAADFARRCGRRVAWFKVEAADDEPRIFFQYLVASIRRQCPDFGHNWSFQFPKQVTDTEMKQMAMSFVYELLEQTREPLLLVIDDLHLVYDTDWVVAFFRHFAPLLPPDVHLLILGRILPPAPLWRMRSKQTLSILDESGLNFTLAEAEQLLDGYGVSREEAFEIYQKARGRAAQLDATAKLRSQNKPAGKLSAIVSQQVYA